MLIEETDLTTEDWQRNDWDGYTGGNFYCTPRIHTFNPPKEYKVYRLVVNATITTNKEAAIARIKFFTPIDQTNDTFQNFKQSNYNSPPSGGGEINALSMTHSLNTSISKLLPVLPVYKKMTIKPKNWTVGQDPTSVANLDGIKIGMNNLYLRFNYTNACLLYTSPSPRDS